MSSSAAVCKGSIALGSECGRCSRCIFLAKEYAIGLRHAPLAKLVAGDREILNRSVQILVRHLGIRGYLRALKGDA